MLAPNDHQLATVMTEASSLPVEKCSTVLERVAARLRLNGSRFTDADLDDAVHSAITRNSPVAGKPLHGHGSGTQTANDGAPPGRYTGSQTFRPAKEVLCRKPTR